MTVWLLIKAKLAHRPKVCLFRSLSSQEKTGWIGVRGQQEVERSGAGSFRRTYSHSRRTNTGATLKCCYARTVRKSVRTARVRKLCDGIFTDDRHQIQVTDINAEVGQGQVLSEDQRVPSEDEYVLVRTKSRPTNKSTQLHVHPKSSRRMLRHPSWVQNNLYQSSRVFLDFRFMTCLSDSPLLWSELCLDLDFDMFWVLFTDLKTSLWCLRTSEVLVHASL